MAESLSEAIIEPIENGLDQIGLMRGDLAPLKRTLVGFGVGWGVLALWKPEFAYDADDGHALPWRVTNKHMDPKQTTMMPWWLAASIPALVLGVLI